MLTVVLHVCGKDACSGIRRCSLLPYECTCTHPEGATQETRRERERGGGRACNHPFADEVVDFGTKILKRPSPKRLQAKLGNLVHLFASLSLDLKDVAVHAIQSCLERPAHFFLRQLHGALFR